MAKQKLSLPVRIFIGMFLGILTGLCFLGSPEFTTQYIKLFGTIYINLLKFLVVPVVLFSITDGVVSLKTFGGSGRSESVLLFTISSPPRWLLS